MATIIQRRKEAAKKGEVVFDAGRSCSRGHDPIRYVSDGQCVECVKERVRKQRREIQGLREQAAKGS